MPVINKKSNMAFGYYASLFPSQNIKVKTVTVTFLSHNSDFYYWNCEFTSCNSDFIGIVRYCKFTVFKVTITHYPLYSMAEISFHKFHMCKGKKQTNKHKNAQSNTHSQSSPLPLLSFSDPTIPLSLPGIIMFSLSDSVLFCIPKTIQRGLFYSMLLILYVYCTPCLFLQLRLESAISKYFSDLKNAYQLHNILYREIFSIPLSCCCCRSRSFILYLRFGTLGLRLCHPVFKHL